MQAFRGVERMKIKVKNLTKQQIANICDAQGHKCRKECPLYKRQPNQARLCTTINEERLEIVLDIPNDILNGENKNAGTKRENI